MDEKEGSQRCSNSCTGSAKPSKTSSHDSRADKNYDLNFYMKFAKPLIFNLPEANDKVIAAAWIKKLRDDSSSEELRTSYLKLLLFVLHRRKLSGPFLELPGSEQIEDLPEGSKILDVAHAILQAEHDEKNKRNQEKQNGGGDYPPILVEVSSDMQQFSSAQEIPRFGSHVYYAIGNDPIHTWDNAESGVLSKEILAGSAKMAAAAPSNVALKSPKSKPLMEAEKEAGKSPLPKTPQAKPISPLIATVVSPPRSDRKRITWGSNLLEVDDTYKSDSEDSDKGDDVDDYGSGGVVFGPEWQETTDNISHPSPGRSPPRPATPEQEATIYGSPSIQPETRKSPVSPFMQGGDVSFDLMDTSIPDQFDESFEYPITPPSIGDRSPINLMSTNIPEEFQEALEAFRESPRKSPKRSPRSPPPMNVMSTNMPEEFHEIIDTPRRSPRSPYAIRDRSPVNLMVRDIPDEFHESIDTLKRASRSPQSPKAQGLVRVGSTGMPQQIQETINTPLGLHEISPVKSSASPKSSLLQHVHHIKMNAMDQEGKDIIEEANKLLEDQELRIQEASEPTPGTSESARDQRTVSPHPPASQVTTLRSPRAPSPIRSPPRPMTPPGGKFSASPHSPTTAEGQASSGSPRTMAELFPGIQDFDTDDDFLFGTEPELVDADFMNDSLKEDLEEQIRLIQQEFALDYESLPSGIGTAATTPSLPMTPLRQRKYGEEFPLMEDEEMPDLFNVSLSPQSKQKIVHDEHGLLQLVSERKAALPEKPSSPVRHPSPQRLPSPPRSLSPPKATSPQQTVLQSAASAGSPARSPKGIIKEKTPSPKRQSPAKEREQERLETAEESKFETLYGVLIAPEDTKPGTPKQKSPQPSTSTCPSRTPSPLRTPSPRRYNLEWTTPPHLKIQAGAPASPPSPVNLTSHLGPTQLGDMLAFETFPDLLPPDTPPKGPEMPSYEEYADPFFYAEGDDYTNLLEEEEPLGAKLQAHEWHPYRPRQFSIKVGARAKNVVLPRKSAAPKVATISEEAEYYYLKSPVSSPAKQVEVDYDAPYMLPSSARRRLLLREQEENKRLRKTPSKSLPSPPKSPRDTAPTTSSEAQCVLEDVQEHIAIEDPRQQSILQHVADVVRTVESEPQTQGPKLKTPSPVKQTADATTRFEAADIASPPKTPSRRLRMPSPKETQTSSPRRTPSRSILASSPRKSPGSPFAALSTPKRKLDFLLEDSPPPGFEDIDEIEGISPCKTPKTGAPTMMPTTPVLDMATPPRGFEDVFEIDQVPTPKTPMRYPTPKKDATPTQTPRFDFADPIEEFIPDYEPFDFGLGAVSGIMDESLPFEDSDIFDNSVGKVTETIDSRQRDSVSQTVRHIERRLNQSWPRSQPARGRQNRSFDSKSALQNSQWAQPKLEYSESDVCTVERTPGARPKTTKMHTRKHTSMSSLPTEYSQVNQPKVHDVIYQQMDVQSPHTTPSKSDGSPTRRQIKKKIQFQTIDDGSQTADQRSRSPRSRHSPAHLQAPPHTPPPEDLMGVEGYVEYTPKQEHLMDTSFSGDGLQTPMRLPINIPGWSTPEHLQLSPQMSPPNFPWIVPVRYPGTLEDENMPEYYDEPYSPASSPRSRRSSPRTTSPGKSSSPERARSPKTTPSPTRTPSPGKTPTHTKHVTKIWRTPDGRTTTTVETLEEISPPHMVSFDENFDYDSPGIDASMQFAPPPPPLPASAFQRSPTTQVSPRSARGATPPPIEEPCQNYSPNAIWNLPTDAPHDLSMDQPELFEEASFQESAMDTSIPYQDVMYQPPLKTPPMGKYASLQSPSQYKTPEYKKTTYIREERPLYDRVQQIIEDVHYEPEELPPISPPQQYTLISPPRPDYFDVLDVERRPGLDTDDYIDLYNSPPPRSEGSPARSGRSPPRKEGSPPCIQSPHTPRLLQREDWDLWNTPPSGRPGTPPLPDFPVPMGNYEPLDMDDIPDLHDSSYVMDDEQEAVSLSRVFEEAGNQFDMDPQGYQTMYDGITYEMPPVDEEIEQGQTPRTRTTTVTEEIYYNEGDNADVPMPEQSPTRLFEMQWDSPPREREPLPTYEPYVPPSLYRPPSPVSPPRFNDNPLDAGMDDEEAPFMYGSPQQWSPQCVGFADDDYHNIQEETTQFYQSP